MNSSLIIWLLLVLSFAEITTPEVLTVETTLPSSSTESLRFNGKSAKRHIQRDTMHIVFRGGFAAPDFNDPEDLGFQKNYHVTFISHGCTIPRNFQPTKYNNRIFKHLDETHGTSWRNEIRDGAYGLEE